MTPTETDPVSSRRVRAQALFDAVLRSRAEVADDVRLHCAAAVSVLGEPFADVAAVRDAATEEVFDVDPADDRIEATLRAGLQELGRLPAEEFRRAFRAAEAGHAALSAPS